MEENESECFCGGWVFWNSSLCQKPEKCKLQTGIEPIGGEDSHRLKMVRGVRKLELKWLSCCETETATWTDIGKEQNLQDFTGTGRMAAQELKVIPKP